MANLMQALGNAARSSYCAILGTQENWLRTLDRALGGLPPDEYASYLGVLQRQLCDQSPPNIPTPQVPSGQCSGVEYNIIVEWQRYNFSLGQWLDNRFEHNGCAGGVRGPISGPEQVTDENSTLYIWTYRNSQNQSETTSVDIATTARIRSFRWRYERCDGNQSAACDDPFPAPNDIWNNTNEVNVTYQQDGTDITINPTFTFSGPQFDVNGNIVIGVGAAWIDADLNIPVNIDFNIPIDLGGFNFDFGGNRDSQDPPSGDGCPPPKPDDAEPAGPAPPSADPEETGEDEEPDPQARIIRAAIVTVREYEVNRQLTELNQDGNPNILIPAAGYISFKINAQGTQAWTNDIPVKNIRNFIPCPWEYGAIDVAGTPRPGVEWTITPVYSTLDESDE